MGGGSWTKDSFASYSASVGRGVTAQGMVVGNYSAQEMFMSRKLDKALDPHNVIRECCDSAEHPETVPVILALDVTGSMGQTAVDVAKKLNILMTNLYGKVKDIEFMIMGIGDLAYDWSPVQASQFESDIRIAEQLDKIWFEGHGGGNGFESYSAAWYFGLKHTKLDCWNRGKKGIIITMGDEMLNPYLPLNGRHCGLSSVFGGNFEDNIETKSLYAKASEKYDIYHIDVQHGHRWDEDKMIEKSFVSVIPDDHFYHSNVDDVVNAISSIIMKATSEATPTPSIVKAGVNEKGEISW